MLSIRLHTPTYLLAGQNSDKSCKTLDNLEVTAYHDFKLIAYFVLSYCMCKNNTTLQLKWQLSYVSTRYCCFQQYFILGRPIRIKRTMGTTFYRFKIVKSVYSAIVVTQLPYFTKHKHDELSFKLVFNMQLMKIFILNLRISYK